MGQDFLMVSPRSISTMTLQQAKKQINIIITAAAEKKVSEA
jgi:hypothetical protein